MQPQTSPFKVNSAQSNSRTQLPPVMMTAAAVIHRDKDQNRHQESNEYMKPDLFEVKEMPVNILKMNALEAVDMSAYTASKFSRVKNNILAALSFLKRYDKVEHDTNLERNDMDVWKEIIGSPQNHSLINDGFWLVVLKKNSSKFSTENESLHLKKKASARVAMATSHNEDYSAKDTYEKIENAILDRMACSYHELLETFRGEQYELFFQVESFSDLDLL
jgi:hypothetical protein